MLCIGAMMPWMVAKWVLPKKSPTTVQLLTILEVKSISPKRNTNKPKEVGKNSMPRHPMIADIVPNPHRRVLDI